jgi:3-oxoacyl-[acyl-carrier-protein] synthase-1
MPGQPLAIVNVGLVTSVGLSAPAACAAIRAAITNHTETRFMHAGDWLRAAQVPLEQPSRGRAKLAQMAHLAIEECVGDVEPGTLPLVLCVAEGERPGRLDGLDEHLFAEIERELGSTFHPDLSAIVAQGRISAAIALAHARRLIYESGVPRVLVAATDSLLSGPTLAGFDAAGRLLTRRNSNGFIPGEAAGAVLVARDAGRAPCLICEGMGFAQESATIRSEEPLRADGLTQAIKLALADAGCELHELDFRITDISGEQYYFKEAALAESRVMRKRKEHFDIWHPADCIGETGAAIGVVALAVALIACLRGYAIGPNILFHSGSDAGRRAAAVLRYEGAA